ncbi:MAG: thioesterase family protein [Nanoarchaeota archaeon]|nr:thioesterase family protein [Nanoarchaeota archaeon]
MEHVHTVRVTYADTDHAGAVYYANYLKWLEIGRTEILRQHNLTYAEFEKQGLVAPVVHVEIDYKESPKYDDEVEIHTTLEAIGTTSITFSYELKKGETLFAVAKTVNVFTKDKKKVSVPEQIRKLL